MSKSLAGTLFIYNGITQDYCYKEAIQSLQGFCDYVIVCDAGSDDGTYEELLKLTNDSLTVIRCEKEEWLEQRGKEKLNYFTNKAIQMAEFLGTDYQFNLQADEIVHEASYPYIKEALETGAEGFHVRRINLWGSPFTQLNVPQQRQPCSEVILRLAKTQYRSVDDAESIATPSCNGDYRDKVRIYHMGFVRDKKIHPQKCRNIQKDVFLLEPDKKLEGMQIFDPWKWFDPGDVIPIQESLPLLIQKWALDRM